jgi:DNA-3-methyladenine glycosylase I
MIQANSYCERVLSLSDKNVHKIYHDTQYGFAIKSDDELFGRLILEINQAGLSWDTILNKQVNFRRAYSNFSIEKIANYSSEDVERLLGDAGIIRNNLKIRAAIFNAVRIKEMQIEYGSFQEWLEKNKRLKLEGWVKLFKQNFKFTGGEITKEFLRSTGVIRGAHVSSCPIAAKIRA